MLLGMIIFFFYRKKIQRALIDWSLEGKAQIQTAGLQSTTAELEDWTHTRCLGTAALAECRGQKLPHKGFITPTSS